MALLDTNRPLAIVGVILGAVVALAILAALLPTFFSSLGDINGVFNDPGTSTGDSTADSLLGIFPILIAIGGLFAVVTMALRSVQVGKK